MTEEIKQDAPLTEEEKKPKSKETAILDELTEKRMAFITTLEQEADLTDPKTASVYLKALDGQAKQTQTAQRLEVESEGAAAASDVARALNDFTAGITRQQQNPFRASTDNAIKLETPQVVESGEFEIREEELNEQPVNQTYDSFMEKRNAQD